MNLLKNKFILGTAQFDFKYGIKKFNDQINKLDIIEILKIAKNQIKYIDTSPNYKNVEKLIGNTKTKNLEYYTKTISLNEFGIDKVKARIHDSFDHLNIKSIEGVYIHHFEDVYNKNFDNLFTFLRNLKDNGKIKQIGFSIYEKKEIEFLINNFDFDILQIPINIFDQRLIANNYLKILKKRKINIIARSIFLQGLLLNINDHPLYFNKWSNFFMDYNNFLKINNMNSIEMCLSFINSIKEIDNIIIGVKNTNQLNAILNANINNSIDFSNLSNADNKLIDPRNWKI